MKRQWAFEWKLDWPLLLAPVIVIAAFLGSCGQVYEPEPVSCFNRQTLERVEGIRQRQYNLGDTLYVRYRDRNGFTMTIHKGNSKDWTCSSV